MGKQWGANGHRIVGRFGKALRGQPLTLDHRAGTRGRPTGVNRLFRSPSAVIRVRPASRRRETFRIVTTSILKPHLFPFDRERSGDRLFRACRKREGKPHPERHENTRLPARLARMFPLESVKGPSKASRPFGDPFRNGPGGKGGERSSRRDREFRRATWGLRCRCNSSNCTLVNGRSSLETGGRAVGRILSYGHERARERLAQRERDVVKV